MTQQLLSTVDGFKIAIGSWIVNLAALIAMLIAIRCPPDYEDEGLKKNAKWTFFLLILLHALVSSTKLHALYFSDYCWDKQTMLMLFVVGMQIWLCSTWLYDEDRDVTMVLTKS